MSWMTVVVRHPWLAVLGGAVLLAVAGFLIAASGVVPIEASSGHWAITEWFLQFSKRRSVATHALLVGTPPQSLEDPALVLRGAGHFETGCRPCHGAPGEGLPRVPRAMTPQPPELSSRITSWTSPQLFYIVKHGVKFTGMPAWPSQPRDDEVWAVVAFLRTLPSLDGRAYQAIVRGTETTPPSWAGRGTTAEPPDVVTEICARCHGLDGAGRGAGAFPKLAGQRREYLDRAMRAYAEGRRHSGIMQTIAASVRGEARDRAVGYYASLAPFSGRASANVSPAARRGHAIVGRGIPDQDIPSCADCHPTSDQAVNAAYPRLAGQYSEYLVQQLELLRARRRGGSEYVHLMHSFVDRLTSAQIADVAAYFASTTQPPQTDVP